MDPTLPTLPLPRLPPRPAASHKGDFGRTLLIGGSRGMSGAIALAGMAALRGGAGLVKLAIPDACADVVAACEPSYMTVPLASDRVGRISHEARTTLAALVPEATCVGCGPGLGRSEALSELVLWLFETAARPLVLDADALNALGPHLPTARRPPAARILTPHPGEFRRLAGDLGHALPPDALPQRAVQLAAEHGLVIVLKGHRTLVTDGHQLSYNTTGNPGMATGGSGDVLTGLIVALVCQGLEPFAAAQLGVYLHGLAGDLAARRLGQVSLIASDLVAALPDAFQQLAAASDEYQPNHA